MATILELRALAGRSTSRVDGAAHLGAASAEIVFFPGVRYERWDEAQPERPAKSKKRRDRLKIDD